MKFIQRLLIKKANWKTLLLCGVLFIIFYFLTGGKPFGVSALKELTGGVGILDLESSYTPEYAYEKLNKLGEKGRNFYLKSVLPLDFIFPLTYMLFLSVSIAFVYKNWLSGTYFLQKLIFIPLITGIIDYLENILISIMLVNYPEEHFNVASFANIMTISKWSLFGGSMLILLVGIGGLSYKKIRKVTKM